METTGKTEGDQILKCNVSLFSEDFILHTYSNCATHTHASRTEEIRKDRKGEKRNTEQGKNGKKGMKSDRESA